MSEYRCRIFKSIQTDKGLITVTRDVLLDEIPYDGMIVPLGESHERAASVYWVPTTMSFEINFESHHFYNLMDILDMEIIDKKKKDILQYYLNKGWEIGEGRINIENRVKVIGNKKEIDFMTLKHFLESSR